MAVPPNHPQQPRQAWQQATQAQAYSQNPQYAQQAWQQGGYTPEQIAIYMKMRAVKKRRAITLGIMAGVLVLALIASISIISLMRGGIAVGSGEEAACESARKVLKREGTLVARKVGGPKGSVVGRIISPEYTFVVCQTGGSSLKTYDIVRMEKLLWAGWVFNGNQMLAGVFNESDLKEHAKKENWELTELK
ncbi:MAG: hypothetical protein LBD01_03260 [Puniceicoccales bacterium]|jgi:hypothetical protein|nr:hypothetical protein [Puniceicoccales bacterium]